jgi:alkylation response protein AidB-like acyl-CoA dehydrogenase
MPIFEEIGRYLVPGPHLDTIGVAAPTILDIGSDAQKREYLPAIAQGDCIVSLAVLEADGGFGPGSVTLDAHPAGDGYELRGTKVLVGWVPSADRLLVSARTSPGTGADGITLFLVDPKAAGVGSSRMQNIAGFPLYAVTFDGVSVAAADVLGRPGGGWRALADNTTKAAVLQASTIIGAARAVLEMTNQYAKDRVQFDIPIGKNQAVQYMVSDILIDLYRADLLARQAAYRIHAGAPYLREAAIAASFAKEASAHFHRQAHEVHAGVAFIDEHDLTLFSRRAKYWENHLGDARHYRELLAEAMDL